MSGPGSDTRETPEGLVQKILHVLKTSLGMRREIPVLKASRLLTGPEIVGSRPVVVSFETFRYLKYYICQIRKFQFNLMVPNIISFFFYLKYINGIFISRLTLR